MWRQLKWVIILMWWIFYALSVGISLRWLQLYSYLKYMLCFTFRTSFSSRFWRFNSLFDQNFVGSILVLLFWWTPSHRLKLILRHSIFINWTWGEVQRGLSGSFRSNRGSKNFTKPANLKEDFPLIEEQWITTSSSKEVSSGSITARLWWEEEVDLGEGNFW